MLSFMLPSPPPLSSAIFLCLQLWTLLLLRKDGDSGSDKQRPLVMRQRSVVLMHLILKIFIFRGNALPNQHIVIKQFFKYYNGTKDS